MGVGEYQPGGVLVGLAADLLADSRFGVMACVFAIPSIAPINEISRSARENAATIARERENFLRVLHSILFFIPAFLARIDRHDCAVDACTWWQIALLFGTSSGLLDTMLPGR